MHPIHELKLDLMTGGVTITADALQALAQLYPGRPVTLAEYASTSGICLELPGGVWVNAPLEQYNPNFVFSPNLLLDCSHDGSTFSIRGDTIETSVRPIPVPDYSNEFASSGEAFNRLAVTHTDRVRISPIEGCAYRCTFCDLPTAFPKYRRKSVADLIESIDRALRDATLPARHILVSGGTPKPEDFDYENEVYAAVADSFPGLEIEVMMAPAPNLLHLKWLHSIGVNAVSINLELFGEKAIRRYAPNKNALGRIAFRQALNEAVNTFGPGRVRSLLMVGLEPMEDTLKGVQFLAELGCQPILSPFRPAPGTREERTSPPTSAYLAETYLRSRDIAHQHDVQLGPTCLACQHNTLTFPEEAVAS